MSVDAAKARILQRINLPELIGEKVDLQLRGGKHVGCCPFHEERSPSFTVFPDHYYCFGCKVHGDAISFVREIQGLTFIEALRYLAEKYSVEVPELEKPEGDKSQRMTEAKLFRICAESAQFFSEQLQRPQGQKARDYLAGRGFQEGFVKEQGFGLSLADPQALTQYLLRKGFAVKDIISSSVGNPSQYDHKAYDFFINRLMIPITDMHGRVIAFGGRTMGDEQPKYKNSRETPLFDKSQVLYGLHEAKDSIRRERQAIVCEGYMDVLQLWQGSVQPAVACLGTALTIYHLRRLAALTPTVYLVFDGDKAGRNATLRTVSLALEIPQTECKVVILPNGHDPDTFIREHGADAFRAQMQDAQGLLEFAIKTRIAETHELGIPELVSKEFVPWLLSVKNPVTRDFLSSRIAELTGIAGEKIDQALRQDPVKKAAPNAAKEERPAPVIVRETQRLKGPELEFFGHLYWSQPGELQLDDVEQLMKTQLELVELWLECGMELLKALRRDLTPAQQNKAFWTSGAAPEVLEMLEDFEKNAPAFTTNVRQKLLEKLAREIRRRHLREALSRLKQTMMKASADEQMELLQAASRITKELNQIPAENRPQ